MARLPGRQERVMLLTKPPNRELDRNIFEDKFHAREWLKQDFVTEDSYEVAIVTVRAKSHRCPKCGEEFQEFFNVKILKRMSVREFLARTVLDAAVAGKYTGPAKHPERRRRR